MAETHGPQDARARLQRKCIYDLDTECVKQKQGKCAQFCPFCPRVYDFQSAASVITGVFLATSGYPYNLVVGVHGLSGTPTGMPVFVLNTWTHVVVSFTPPTTVLVFRGVLVFGGVDAEPQRAVGEDALRVCGRLPAGQPAAEVLRRAAAHVARAAARLQARLARGGARRRRRARPLRGAGAGRQATLARDGNRDTHARSIGAKRDEEMPVAVAPGGCAAARSGAAAHNSASRMQHRRAMAASGACDRESARRTASFTLLAEFCGCLLGA